MDVRNCSGTQVADSAGAARAAWDYLEATTAGRATANRVMKSGGVAVLEKAKTAVHENGMYRVRVSGPSQGIALAPNSDEAWRVFKVQKAVHGSGHLYAKELVPDGHEGDWHFVYAPGAIRTLFAEDKMTLEEAKEFGVLYGTCCVCGRTLTDEKSIAAGIGPICAKKF
jgi:hypothetical protein